jgi:hypothetical protein
LNIKLLVSKRAGAFYLCRVQACRFSGKVGLIAIVVGARLRFGSNGRGVGLFVALGQTDPKNGRACCLYLGIFANSDMYIGSLRVYTNFSVSKVYAK